jgi:hypothetical protein
MFTFNHAPTEERSMSIIYLATRATAISDGLRWVKGRADAFDLSVTCVKIQPYNIGIVDEQGIAETGIAGIFDLLEWKFDTSPWTFDELLKGKAVKS